MTNIPRTQLVKVRAKMLMGACYRRFNCTKLARYPFYHITTLVSRLNKAFTNFLVTNTCKIRFHDVIYRTVRMFT